MFRFLYEIRYFRRLRVNILRNAKRQPSEEREKVEEGPSENIRRTYNMQCLAQDTTTHADRLGQTEKIKQNKKTNKTDKQTEKKIFLPFFKQSRKILRHYNGRR